MHPPFPVIHRWLVIPGFLLAALAGPGLVPCLRAEDPAGARQMERLGRGMVAVRRGDGKVFVGWRLLGTDPDDIVFNLYRTTDDGRPVKLNPSPIAKSTSFLDEGADPGQSLAYSIRPVLGGREEEAIAPFRLAASAPARPYLAIPLRTPEG
jgi:rhamnogalacturonan endolyase